MTILPTPAPRSTQDGLQLIDLRENVESSTPAGTDQTATVTFPQVPEPYLWLIDRLVVSTTAEANTVARVYVDYVDPEHLVNATANGNLDVDDSNSPLLVDTASQLIVVWSGIESGFVATARAQYRLMVRS